MKIMYLCLLKVCFLFTKFWWTCDIMLELMIRRRRFKTALTIVIILPHYGIQNVKPVCFACKLSRTALLIILHVLTVSSSRFSFTRRSGCHHPASYYHHIHHSCCPAVTWNCVYEVIQWSLLPLKQFCAKTGMPCILLTAYYFYIWIHISLSL